MWLRNTPYRLDGFSGGVVDSSSPSTLSENEVLSIRNRIIHGRSLRMRPGLRLVNPGGLDSLLDKDQHRIRTIIVHVDPLTLSRTVICGGYSAFSRLDPATGRLVSLPTIGGLVQPSYRQFFADQVLGTSYWSREGTGLLRVTPGTVSRCGIAAPTGAVTIADSGTDITSLPAGEYVAVCRYRNRSTGAVSNYGPVSNSLTIAANRGIVVTGIPISGDYQVDTRDIALTIADRPGTYYDLGSYGQLGNNILTTMTLSGFGQNEYGNPLDQVHAAPPSDIICSSWWRSAQCLAYSDGRALFLSETGLPESWGGIEFEFDREDGYPINSVAPRGRELLVGKGNSVGIITGVDRATFGKDILTEAYGVAAPHSLRSSGSTSFWLASVQDGLCVVRSDGGSVEPISTGKIERTLASIPAEFRSHCFGSIWPRLGLYVLSISRGQVYNDDGSARYVHDTLLTYNYTERAWTDRGDFDPRVLSRPSTTNFASQDLSPVSLFQFDDGEGNTRIYAAFDYSRRVVGGDSPPRLPGEFIYEIDPDATRDLSSPIPWRVVTRPFYAPTRRRHRPRSLHLSATPGEGCTVTVRLYKSEAPPNVVGEQSSSSFILDNSDGDGPQTYILPLKRDGADTSPATVYTLSIEGDRHLDEIHSGEVEMTETSAHRLARKPRELSPPGGEEPA